ncbi:Protein kintoun [Hondaea fermentalgiana]|uniref:Protein kintoun n=1 Tax=Hondaea fermentalgiana TaxID=2315210 RepID=A0A2R5GEW3_9STRA|nr:Protein kintoun [Hondaea fermentalgiana]|eukprot:GBG29482.1 Protein kintoun [Hondaea fermentalgiana]
MASAHPMADFGALNELFAKADLEEQARGTSGGDKAAGLVAKPTKVVTLADEERKNSGGSDDNDGEAARETDEIWAHEEVDTAHVAALKAPQDGRAQPEYDIVYKQCVGAETVFFGMDDIDPSSNSCAEIVIKIKLPNQQMKDLDLDVQRQSLVLSSPDYRLATYLPYAVDHDKGSAKWDAEKSQLSVTLPIAFEASCLSLPGRITCREEWDAFTRRLVATGLLDAHDDPFGDDDDDDDDDENNDDDFNDDLAIRTATRHAQHKQQQQRRASASESWTKKAEPNNAKAWCKSVWARTRPFGSNGEDITFEDVCRFLRQDFADQLEGDPVLEARRALTTAKQQIAALGRVVENWAPDATQTRQMIEMAIVLHKDLDSLQEPVQALAQAQHSDFVLQATSPRRNGQRCDPTPFAFQQTRCRDIEQRCATYRVRGAPLRVDARGRRRTSPLKLSDKLRHTQDKSLEVSLASTSSGALIEVVTLRGSTEASDDDIAFALNCHAAHRELMLSSYFPDWMGYSRSSEIYYEHIPGCQSLASLLDRIGPMEESQPLLAAILAQTLAALCDLLEQSTFTIRSPLGPQNVFLVDKGTRVVVGAVDWGSKETCHSRRGTRGPELFDVFAWQRARERAFLGAFATIIGACLGTTIDTNTSCSTREQSNDDADDAPTCTTVFTRAQCDAGIRVSVDTTFRLSLPPSAPGKLWRCARLVDSGVDPTGESSSGLRSQIVALHDPDSLEFYASRPGLVRMYLQELEWWQDPSDLGRLETSAPSMMCKVSVVPDRADAKRSEQPRLSSQLGAVLSACQQGSKAKHGHLLGLRELQSRSALLDVEAIDFEAVQDDFHVYVGAGEK